MADPDLFDDFIAPNIRADIETRFYAKINQQSQLSEALKDPQFLEDPAKHVALFSDHGVVHVRDVTGQILHVLKTIHGVLIPTRSEQRMQWMQGYGVMVTYLHDIGMVDMSPFGRAMHPEFAAQAALDSGFDAIMAQLWADDRSGLAARLAQLDKAGVFAVSPQIVLREMAAMSMCHSKSKVPVELLNYCSILREILQAVQRADLNHQYCEQRLAKARRAAATVAGDGSDNETLAENLRAAEAAMNASNNATENRTAAAALEVHYTDFDRDGFALLTSANPDVQELFEDIIDTLCALRCADALRQRGTVLKTSGNYKVFVDQRSANAIYALRLD